MKRPGPIRKKFDTQTPTAELKPDQTTAGPLGYGASLATSIPGCTSPSRAVLDGHPRATAGRSFTKKEGATQTTSSSTQHHTTHTPQNGRNVRNRYNVGLWP